MITDFKNKKLVEYFEEGNKFLIRFGHGLGDTIMFLPVLDKLRELYRDKTINIYLECGQEKIWGSEKDKEGKEYDFVFSLDFPMSEGSNETKVQKCCREEIGIEAPNKLANFLNYHNPIICVHFQGTSLPNSVRCPENIAKQIWQEIINAGYIPLEVHFEHIFHNPINSKYNFINRDVRDIPANLDKLIGLIQNSRAFIGVASGPLMVALGNNIDTLYLENKHDIKTYTDRNIPKIDVNNFDINILKKWLETLSYGPLI